MREFVGIKSPLDLLLEVTSARLQIPNVFKREAYQWGKAAQSVAAGVSVAHAAAYDGNRAK